MVRCNPKIILTWNYGLTNVHEKVTKIISLVNGWCDSLIEDNQNIGKRKFCEDRSTVGFFIALETKTAL